MAVCGGCYRFWCWCWCCKQQRHKLYLLHATLHLRNEYMRGPCVFVLILSNSMFRILHDMLSAMAFTKDDKRNVVFAFAISSCLFWVFFFCCCYIRSNGIKSKLLGCFRSLKFCVILRRFSLKCLSWLYSIVFFSYFYRKLVVLCRFFQDAYICTS